MIETTIRLKAMDDVCEFVRAAEKCDFKVDLSYNGSESGDFAGRRMDEGGRMTAPPGGQDLTRIDAKSILGVMSMDLTRVLTVKYGAQDGAFEKVLQKFAAV